MKIFEIGTGYTSIPARMGAATEIVVAELTNSFLKLSKDVTIVDIKDKNRLETELPIVEAYMPQFFSSTDTTLGVVHKLKRVLYSISLTYKLHGLIRKCKDKDIVLHFHNQYNLFFFLKLTPASIRKRVKIAYTVHSYIWFGKWEDIKDTISRRYFQEVYCCQHADKVFVLNEIVANMLREHYGVDASKIINIINGVNTDVYTGTQDDEAAVKAIKHDYHLDGKNIVIQVGSVCDRKNQLSTLKLLAPLMKRDKSLAFIYAGGIIDAEYEQQIQDFAKSEGIQDNVHYMGEVAPGKQLNHLYAISKCAFMNSKSEAFALVIAEALAARRPIFINEAIMQSLVFLGKNQGNGIVRVTDSFESDLHRLLTDDSYYRELQERGRKFIEKEYSWDVAAKQYYDNF